MRKGKLLVLTLVVGISFILIGASLSVAAAAGKPIELSLYWALGNKTLQYKGMTKFMDAAEKRTNGRVKFKRFCCGTMGADLESLEQMRIGALDIRTAGLGVYAPYHAPINMTALPYVFKDYDHLWKFVESPLWYELVKGLEKSNMKPITNFNAGFRDVFNSKRPVHRVEDLKGLKLKVPRIPSFITLWKTLGAIPHVMKVTEQYMAMKTGVVDGAEMSMINAKNNKMYEVTKYYTVLQICWLGPLMTMNLDRWNGLPGDIQKIITEEAKKGAKWTFVEGERQNREALRWMEKEKGLIVDWNPDTASFQAKVEEAYKVYAKEKWFDSEMIRKIRAIK
ncbi:MAG: TRAP transporter substrate-binding protein [Deltaproteobacteria bacterium]|nr:MAG: TRAP transporter substrate-binding protein [Deltaproteobacteria bacterium]